MDPLAILFGLGLLVLVPVALVLGVAAYVRIRSLERSVRDLGLRMFTLQEQVKRTSESVRAEEMVKPPSVEPMRPPATPAASVAPAAPWAAQPPPIPTATRIVQPPPIPSASSNPATSNTALSNAALSNAGTSNTPLSSTTPPNTTPPNTLPSFASFASAPSPSSTGAPPAIPPEHAPTSAGVDIERWLGGRGAAVGGGIAIAIAGFLFLKYSIEQQMITPQMRVIIGACVGVGCFLAAIPLRQRGYDIVASSITGAGAVLLYAASWAAHVLYGMIGFPTAFAAMVGVTVVCGWLAQRHASHVIAVLGLVGGFATPLLLSSHVDRPVSLFGYVLLLDFGFLFVAQKRRWPSVGLLALIGTFVIQALWIGAHMTHERLLFALVMLSVFAFAFVVIAAQVSGPERRRWIVSQSGGLLVPFVFAAWFAQDIDLGPRLWPLACFAGVLAVAAGWVARRGDMPWLPFGSAIGAVSLVLTWAVSRDFRLDFAHQEELFGCALGLALVHLVVAEMAVLRPVNDDVRHGARNAVLAAAIGFQFVAVAALTGPRANGPWPWLGLTTAMALCVLRIVALGAPAAAAIASTALAGLTACAWSRAHVAVENAPFTLVWCGALVSFGGVVLLSAWLLRRRAPWWVFWSVAAFGEPAMFATNTFDVPAGAAIGMSVAAVLVLGAQIAFAGTASRSSALYGCAVLASWSACLTGGFDTSPTVHGAHFEELMTLALIHVAVFTLWPIVRPAYWVGRTNTWRTAALVPLVWFPIVHVLFVEHWPDAPVFLVPLAFEALSVFAALCLWHLRADEDRAQRTGRILFACVAILFAAMMVPLQVGHEVVGVTLALFAFGIALLGRRIEARELTWASVIALVASTILLVAIRPWSWFDHYFVRVWNPLAYAYLLPALAAVLAGGNLRRSQANVVASGIAVICAVVLVFAWINLEIADAFCNLPDFSFEYETLPGRDMALSIAWAIYALVLLGLGVGRGRGALRWASLVLLMLTIGKVFLFDLDRLEGLYRAASVFGLGLSLLFVSVLYQRFVFRRVRIAT